MKPIYRCRVCGALVEDHVHCGKRAELILDASRRLRLSKLLSFILRHCPECVDIEMDRQGWVCIDELVKAIKEKWRNRDAYSWLSTVHVIAVAKLDPKGRFEVRNGFIRARYGHQSRLGISIDYDVDTTSRVLYHGTSARNLSSILREGLKPMKRSYVHLTTSIEDACAVGARHGREPVVLYVDVECLRLHGLKVFVASPSVRLVSYVPTKCISKVDKCCQGSRSLR